MEQKPIPKDIERLFNRLIVDYPELQNTIIEASERKRQQMRARPKNGV